MARRPCQNAYAAVAVFALPLIVTMSGCRNLVEATNTGVDAAYLRAPGEATKTAAVVKIPDGPLFPLAAGDRWEMVQKSENQESSERIAVAGPITLNGQSGMVVEMSQGGRTVRQEVFRSDAKGLFLLAAGTPADRMTLSPPIPLLHKPVQEGEEVPWEGTLHYRKTTAPGTALSRVSGREQVKTPAGTFGAYRIDTIISTTVEGQPVSFPTTRWLAPGVGLVRQRLLAGNNVVTKELTSYKVGQAVAGTNR
jgi:hypothetical protein